MFDVFYYHYFSNENNNRFIFFYSFYKDEKRISVPIKLHMIQIKTK